MFTLNFLLTDPQNLTFLPCFDLWLSCQRRNMSICLSICLHCLFVWICLTLHLNRFRQIDNEQHNFMFFNRFTKWIWFANSFKCFSYRNVWPPGQRAEIRERIASESLQKILTKFCEVAGHVGRVKTVVKNHIRKMFRSRILLTRQQNATATGINWDKLTEINS